MVPGRVCRVSFVPLCRKAEEAQDVQETLDSKSFNDDPCRFKRIQFVKGLVIHAGCPFSIAEHPRVRKCLSVMCPDKLDVSRLNNKAVSRFFLDGLRIFWHEKNKNLGLVCCVARSSLIN